MTAQHNATDRQKTRVTWELVLGALRDEKALSTVLARLQALQNKGVEGRVQPVPAASLTRSGLEYQRAEPLTAVRDFGTSREARDTVCGALTYVEDWLDYEWRGKTDVRERVARVRRRLESEMS